MEILLASRDLEVVATPTDDGCRDFASRGNEGLLVTRTTPGSRRLHDECDFDGGERAIASFATIVNRSFPTKELLNYLQK